MGQHDFKKQFGQNFLKDDYYAKILVSAAKIKSDETVIEIGAGHGVVTAELAKHAKKVIALDIDSTLMAFLKKKFEKTPNVEILNNDILDWDYLKKIGDEKYKIVSSLPYNVAKKIIKIFITSLNPPEIISVIIQKEVADNYLAKAPKATFLGNFANIYSDIEYIDAIPNYAFFPEPKVQSSIITIKPHKPITEDAQKFITFMKSGYSNPRKKLSNNISNYLKIDKGEIEKVLKKTNISVNSRPENLKLEEWLKLFGILTIRN